MRAPEVRIRPLTAASLPSTNCSDRIKTSASIALAFWSTSSAVGSIVSVLIVLSIGARRSGSSMPSDLTSPAVTLSTDCGQQRSQNGLTENDGASGHGLFDPSIRLSEDEEDVDYFGLRALGEVVVVPRDLQQCA